MKQIKQNRTKKNDFRLHGTCLDFMSPSRFAINFLFFSTKMGLKKKIVLKKQSIHNFPLAYYTIFAYIIPILSLVSMQKKKQGSMFIFY